MKIDPLPSLQGSNDNQPSPRSGWVFRKLWPQDAPALCAHLLRLDPEQRACRFGRPVADEWIATYCASTDWARSVTLGCWVAGELRGVSELKILDTVWPRWAELALSVERAFETRGIGTDLFHRVLPIARNRGITRAYLLCLPANQRVQRIVRRLQPRLAYQGDQIEGEIELSLPDPLSIAAELCDDGCALVLSLWDWQRGLALAA
ncbi:MAG TPA: GNAT family N-acetyltransferase [Stellaceae bacterium]|nr:GNAT family N-acetyltransferase [Stellaceae bacterium]